MAMPIRRSLPLVALVLAAGGAEKMEPTPAKVPRPTTPSTHLIDQVLPAYGMAVPETASRADAMFQRIHGFVDDLEAKAMAGELHASAPHVETSGAKRKKGEPAAPTVASGELATLHALGDELTDLEKILHPADDPVELPITEQWQLDACFTDLSRAADLLRVGLDDAAFAALVSQHQAWMQSYQTTAGPAREAKLAELMKTQKLSRHEAEEALVKLHWEAPYPGTAASVSQAPTVQPSDSDPHPAAVSAPTDKPAPVIAPPKAAPLAPTQPVAHESATPAVAEPEPENPAMATPEPATDAAPATESSADQPKADEAKPEDDAKPVAEPKKVDAPTDEPKKATPAPASGDLPDL